MGIESIWSTPEAEAWARGFSYTGYLGIQSYITPDSAPVSEVMYKELCDVFEKELERDSFKGE